MHLARGLVSPRIPETRKTPRRTIGPFEPPPDIAPGFPIGFIEVAGGDDAALAPSPRVLVAGLVCQFFAARIVRRVLELGFLCEPGDQSPLPGYQLALVVRRLSRPANEWACSAWEKNLIPPAHRIGPADRPLTFYIQQGRGCVAVAHG